MAGAKSVGSEIGLLLPGSMTLNTFPNFSNLFPYLYNRDGSSSDTTGVENK